MTSRWADELAFATDLARRAGAILLDSYERVETIDYKSKRDVVTDADYASERLVIGAIKARYPGDAILAEESGEHAGVLRDDGSGNGRTWVIDPLDGTVNYANGIPFYCVSIGLVVDDRPTVGVILDPARDDLYAAAADGPARLDGEPVSASTKQALSDYVVSLAVIGRGGLARERRIAPQIRIHRRMGSAALALAYVANGRFDAFVQNGGLSPWDVAAAGLIAERAGAVVTDLAGGPWWNPRLSGPRANVVAAPAAAARRPARCVARAANHGPDSPLTPALPVEDVGEHPEGEGRCAPHHHPAVPIRPGPQRHPARDDLLNADDVGVPQGGERKLDDGGHLGVVRHERRPGWQGADEGEQLEVADRDPDRVERPHYAHVVRRQADLLPRLAQCGGLGPGVGRVDRAAGQRHFTGVGAQVTVPHGQRHDQAAVGIGIDGQQGRGGARRREVAALEAAAADLPVQGARQEPLVEWDRAWRGVQRTGQRILPAGLLA